MAKTCQVASVVLSSEERQHMDSCDPCQFVYADVEKALAKKEKQLKVSKFVASREDRPERVELSL